MKYNWEKFVKESRMLFAKHVTFGGSDAKARKAEFNFTLLETDAFHPFYYDSEYTLDDLFAEYATLPKKCNYRSIDSYHQWKDLRFDMVEAVRDWLGDMYCIAVDHYADRWNFPPGYTEPKDFKFNEHDVSDREIVRMLGRCR